MIDIQVDSVSLDHGRGSGPHCWTFQLNKLSANYFRVLLQNTAISKCVAQLVGQLLGAFMRRASNIKVNYSKQAFYRMVYKLPADLGLPKRRLCALQKCACRFLQKLCARSVFDSSFFAANFVKFIAFSAWDAEWRHFV